MVAGRCVAGGSAPACRLESDEEESLVAHDGRRAHRQQSVSLRLPSNAHATGDVSQRKRQRSKAELRPGEDPRVSGRHRNR